MDDAPQPQVQPQPEPQLAPQISPAPEGVIEPPKPSRWRVVFLVLGIMQVLGVALFFGVMIWLWSLVQTGLSGTEFIGLILFVTVVPFLGIVGLLNVIGLPIYIAKRKPRGMGLVFSIISLSISGLLVVFGAYMAVQLFIIVPLRTVQLREELSREYITEDYSQFGKTNTPVEPAGITKAEATALLTDCKVNFFAGYTDISLIENEIPRGWFENMEQTGADFEYSEGEQGLYLFASKAMTAEMQDTVRQIRQDCYDTQKLYIVVDDWIETPNAQGEWVRVKQGVASSS